VPAALENQITAANSLRIRAKIIAEAANGPVSATADDMLENRGVVVIPDILCNAGGVVVSYFEWIQNLSHVRMNRLEMRYDQKSKERLLEHLSNIAGRYHDKPVNMMNWSQTLAIFIDTHRKGGSIPLASSLEPTRRTLCTRVLRTP
jgi:glutamate dehydrogenase/leucine dehydrogenase